jgi:3-oxoadipate enol-lactonase
MSRVRQADASIHYEVHGDGPTLVFAHGAGGNGLSWWQQVPAFARAYRVLTFDHRGFGRSSCEDFHPRYFADDLAAILDAEGIERVALVCQSMGGWTGLPFALRHPERVASLVLACTPGGYVNAEVLASAAGVGERIAAAGIDHTPALSADFVRRRPDLRFLYDRIGELNTGVGLSAVSKLFDPEARVSADALRSLRAPVLMLSGSDDLLFPPETLRSVARDIPGARLEEIAGAGHSIYFELPERFNQLVAEFAGSHAG